jgi:hypothetical protein
MLNFGKDGLSCSPRWGRFFIRNCGSTLGAVVTMMQLSDDWHDFMKKLDRLRPGLDLKSIKKGQQLSFDERTRGLFQSSNRHWIIISWRTMHLRHSKVSKSNPGRSGWINTSSILFEHKGHDGRESGDGRVSRWWIIVLLKPIVRCRHHVRLFRTVCRKYFRLTASIIVEINSSGSDGLRLLASRRKSSACCCNLLKLASSETGTDFSSNRASARRAASFREGMTTSEAVLFAFDLEGRDATSFPNPDPITVGDFQGHRLRPVR